MNTLPLVTQMFALTAIGALVWLTVRAFKTNAGWGIAVLLLSPFSATVFGVKHWEKEREPFLLYITTFTATFALCVYLFTVSGGLELLRLSTGIQQGNSQGDFMRTSYAVEEASVKDGRFLQVSGVDVAGAQDPEIPAEEADREDEPAMEKEKTVRYRLTYIPIKLAETKNYIGKTAKITRKNVPEKEYRITGVSTRHIELAQRSSGGQYSFHFKNSDIDNIRVLVNEPY
jgi:hypothetical protein